MLFRSILLFRFLTRQSYRLHTGAWIETQQRTIEMMQEEVASFTGAWIETPYPIVKPTILLSHPLRVRGLKLMKIRQMHRIRCRILYGCVD